MSKAKPTIDLREHRYNGAILKEKRDQKKMTLDQVEAAVGVSRDLVHRAERSSNIPNAEDLLKLMIYFKIKPVDLLTV